MDFIWLKFYESCYFYSNKFSHQDFLISWRIALAYIHDRKLQVGWQRWRGRRHWASHLESRGDRCGDQWGPWHLSSRQASGWLGRLGRWWMLRGDALHCNVNMGGWSRNIGIFYQQDGGSIWFNQQKQSTKPTLMGYIYILYYGIYLASNMILWKWNRLRLVLMVENLGCLKVMYCKWMLSWARNVEIHPTRKIWDHYIYIHNIQ